MRVSGWSGLPFASLLAVSLAGCAFICCDNDRGWFRISNGTDRVVDVFEVGRVEVPLVVELVRGGMYPINQNSDRRCTGGDLVVRDHETGVELLRRTEPVCKGDDWIITLPGPPQPSLS